ncbi:hypothetical protein ACMFMG_001937 [Clarireedia jacksonii]
MSSSDDPGFISTPAGFNLATDGKPAGEHSNELEWVEWTPELERKNSKGGVSKNYHKKVRTGCLRCRARRVKAMPKFWCLRERYTLTVEFYHVVAFSPAC